MPARNAWITCPRPNPNARMRLLCIPPAGGGASAFRTWPGRLPPDVEVQSVRLPGRENRIMEPPLARVSAVVDELLEVLVPGLDRPFALLGHSMGGLLCFELARALRRHSAPIPTHLVIASYRAPRLADGRASTHELPDAEFAEEVKRRYDAIPTEVHENAELMALLLPTLRADISICETYVYVEEEPLPCPITALGGEQDGQVSRADLEAWRGETSGSFRLHMFPGDHFFLRSAEALVAEEVGRAIQP